ncbi:MAG: type 1 glutamine amidotransferase [Alphaproteobacteria bacterium]|nr:type 1 glutamine amidotransferase [Alphaproteobacteria bacterium]
MTNGLRFLVVDGYAKEGRAELASGGASAAGDLYQAMLVDCAPGAVVEFVYPADADGGLPQGTALDAYDGICWTGSSLTIFDDDPQVHRQIDFAKAAFAAGVPSFGSCWAAQIAVVAAGGLVQANPRGREMGIARKIQLTPEGRAHPMYEGKANVFDAFISHFDEVTHLPAGAVMLASNAFTHVQAVAVTHRGGTFWGLQYHPEYDLHELARLTYCRIGKLVELGFFADREAAESYVDKLEVLHQDPSRKDLAWLLGIDDDVMNQDVRRLEVRNWIERLVRPSLRR